MAEHIAVLANPFAGKGRGARSAEVAIGHLRARGAEVQVFIGRSAADTARLAVAALADGPRALVVVGGDGTLAGILDTVCEGSVPVVLVAAGTGNDLARALGLPRGDSAAAAELAVTGVPRSIDVGMIRTADGTRRFLTVAALGFDAKVSDRTNRLRWPHGALRYYLALLVELARLRPMDFTLAIDGDAAGRQPGTLIAVGSTASYGGGMPICVGAVPDDGLLDIVHVAPLGRLRLLRLFPLLLRGTHLVRREVTHRRARTVTVSAPGLVVYADGERIGEHECTLSVLPGALTLMVPEEKHD
ncbi:YegS/Rv2252/BmrU family lipid kinase [Microbacterium algeriense]|uniref:YegS/Rv2252/BmrU family lipid kinase n=1 Tax=Microbacterium algeriense TaxID=2615184 RepID=A0ABQ6V5V1_9MICO|nr:MULTISPECIES: YegS/Rv2252/BmrU family lipid kinase [Microbacterium]KAB1864768.1 YegS/Rv2252/BmrU family lipid kinase [Microbacterium algeriense]